MKAVELTISAVLILVVIYLFLVKGNPGNIDSTFKGISGAFATSVSALQGNYAGGGY